jgi:hypothetical protein
MPGRHTAAITAWPSAPIGDRERLAALSPDPIGGIVARSTPYRLASLPNGQSRREIKRITAARTGFEHWTLRCIKCGLIHEPQVSADPMKSVSNGWEARRPEFATVRTMT